MKFFKLATPTILVLCVFSTTLFGQLNHPKKNYWGEDEKLYWNKSLPVYVRLATGKDDGAETFLLKSDSTAEFAEPFYFAKVHCLSPPKAATHRQVRRTGNDVSF